MVVIGIIAACLVLRRWRLLLFTMPLAAIHGWFLWPTLQLGASCGDGSADFRVMLANVLTSNPEHQAIIDCGLANNAEVIVILELSSELAQELEKEWAVSHPYQKTLPQDWANFGIGGTLNGLSRK